MRRAARVGVALLFLLFLPSAAFAQESPTTQTVEIEFTPNSPPREIQLWRAIGEAANRGADLALDRAFGDTRGDSGKKIAWRLGRLWLVSMPIAAFAHGGAHDSGHFARDADVGGTVHGREIVQWPWPVPVLVTVENRSGDLPDLPPRAFLGAIGGGEQAALVLRRQMTDAAYVNGGIGYFDATLLAYAALDFSVYAWTDLTPHHFASEDGFYEEPRGDFRQYVWAEACREQPEWAEPTLASMDRFAAQIRRSAWLNLADTALWASVHRAVQYVATGEASGEMPTIHVGAVRFAAGAYATLGSTGLERGVDVRVQQERRVIRLNLRSVSVPDGRVRWGGGLSILPRERTGLRPIAQLDVWQQLDRGTGVRIEAGLRRSFKKSPQPFDTGFRAGYKTDGYVPDAPFRRGALLTVFTTVRF